VIVFVLRGVASAIVACCTVPFLFAQASSPQSESEKARQLVSAGRSDEAIPIYKQLAQEFPTNPDVFLNLAIAEFNSKRFHDAAHDAEAALKIKPDLAAADLFLGASRLRLGEYTSAVGPLEKAVAARGTDVNARVMLAEALYGAKRYDEALQRFRTNAELLPDNPRVWYGLGRTYDALAEQASRELQTKWPESSYSLLLSGDLCLKQHRYGAAFHAYNEALSKQPSLSGIQRRIAQIYSDTGHPDWAARERSLSATSAAPVPVGSGPAASHYSSYTKNRELATAAYNHLLQLPPSLEQHFYQAAQFEADGQYHQAAAEWEAAWKLNPGDLHTGLSLARALYRSQEYEAALPILTSILELEPDSAEANFLSGATLLNLERPDAAVPYLQASLRADPKLDAAAAALGQALLQQGKPVQAIPFLERGLSADDDGNAHFQLFRAYQQTGNGPLAKRALEAYRLYRATIADKRRVDDGSQISPPAN
jgi:tetratricopeptide (TPR) repeat protein